MLVVTRHARPNHGQRCDNGSGNSCVARSGNNRTVMSLFCPNPADSHPKRPVWPTSAFLRLSPTLQIESKSRSENSASLYATSAGPWNADKRGSTRESGQVEMKHKSKGMKRPANNGK